MGVDTKGFVLTKCKDVFLVTALLQRAFDHLIIAERIQTFGTPYSEDAQRKFRSSTITLSPEGGMAHVGFTFRGAQRRLALFFTCDCDQSAYGPDSISLSMGCYGESSLFVKLALHALSVLGPVYLDENDCDDVDPAPLGEKRLSILEAVGLGYINVARIRPWLTAWDAGQLSADRTFEQFFGAPESHIRELVARTDYKEAWDEIATLAKHHVVVPVFMEEFHHESVGNL